MSEDGTRMARLVKKKAAGTDSSDLLVLKSSAFRSSLIFKVDCLKFNRLIIF